jgi:hypothetical protein
MREKYKSDSDHWDDGEFVSADTKEFQLASVREFMKCNGYELVYTDSSVFFRYNEWLHKSTDPYVKTVMLDPKSRRTVSFAKGVSLHNRYKHPSKYVSRAKLYRKKNEILVHCHKVIFVRKF